MMSVKEMGKLKIFFGYAPGVGKTEAMIKSAFFSQKEGEDVVIGFLTSEARMKYRDLINGLEMRPLKAVKQPEGSEEFDLDGALQRHPKVILIDELAHTNKAGCRHLKRYQDVEELLRAGIDVCTTLNVGELESFEDIPFSTLGTKVVERVPDHIFDRAAEVEFVDRIPEDIILQTEGLNPPPEDTELPGKFKALREIALRRLVERLNRIEGLTDRKSVPGIREHILLCLSSAPSNAKVIRTAVRLAEVFNSGITALFVDAADNKKGSQERQERLKANIKLAEDLGARIATVYGDDLALQIAEYAKAAGVSKIVLGSTNTQKFLFFKKNNMVDRLMQMAPEIDIYVIPDAQKPYWHSGFLKSGSIHFSVKELIKVFVIEAVASFVGLLFYRAHLGPENIITIYILGVLFSAIWTDGWIYGVINSMLSVIIFNFLFTEPRFTLLYYDARYAITFIVMLIASLVTSSFTTRVKKQARKEARKAYRTEVLLETSHKLEKTEEVAGIMKATAEQLCKLLDRTIVFYPAISDGSVGSPIIFPVNKEEDISQYITEEEKSVVEWVCKNNKHAGATTKTLPDTNCLYLAVRGQKEVLAVAGIAMSRTDSGRHRELDSDEKNLMMAMLDECGLVLEKQLLNEEKRKAEVKAEQEMLRANLLRTISHDLRTPLTSVIGNAGILMEKSALLDEGIKHQLCVDIFDDATWLVNLVENLLSITRIENGTMNLESEAELIDEVFQEALAHLDRKSSEHTIRVSLEDDLLMAKIDARLIVQVVINIVNNAVKYTQKDSVIVLSAERKGDMVSVTIADDGPGISDEAKKTLFEMFVTADKKRGDSRRGLGLGLALCKAIINAHGGEITICDNQPHGAVFTFTLQVAEVNSYE
ncbi:MAG: sensor histidine kinase KdpD [Clostridium sp.]